MKQGATHLITAALLMLSSSWPGFALGGGTRHANGIHGSVPVSGYHRRDGAYFQLYYRSAPGIGGGYSRAYRNSRTPHGEMSSSDSSTPPLRGLDPSSASHSENGFWQTQRADEPQHNLIVSALLTLIGLLLFAGIKVWLTPKATPGRPGHPTARSTAMPPNRPAPVAHRVQVSARLLHWPQQCACCGGPSHTSLTAGHTRVSGKRVIRTSTRSWDVPYCSDCRQHVRLAQAAWGPLIGGSIGGIFLFLVGMGTGDTIGFLASSLLAGGVVWASVRSWRSQMARAVSLQGGLCCSLGPAVIYHGWYGRVHTFTFYSRAFIDAFRRLNASKVLT